MSLDSCTRINYGLYLFRTTDQIMRHVKTFLGFRFPTDPMYLHARCRASARLHFKGDRHGRANRFVRRGFELDSRRGPVNISVWVYSCMSSPIQNKFLCKAMSLKALKAQKRL